MFYCSATVCNRYMNENIGHHHVLHSYVQYDKNIWHVESPQHGSRVENRKIMKRTNKFKCKWKHSKSRLPSCAQILSHRVDQYWQWTEIQELKTSKNYDNRPGSVLHNHNGFLAQMCSLTLTHKLTDIHTHTHKDDKPTKPWESDCHPWSPSSKQNRFGNSRLITQ